MKQWWKCNQATVILDKAHKCRQLLRFKDENEGIFLDIFPNPFNQSLSCNLFFTKKQDKI